MPGTFHSEMYLLRGCESWGARESYFALNKFNRDSHVQKITPDLSEVALVVLKGVKVQ